MQLFKPMVSFFPSSLKSGQAILEYLIMLFLVLALVFVMVPSIQTSIAHLWAFMAKNIVAPCPGCAVDSSIQF